MNYFSTKSIPAFYWLVGIILLVPVIFIDTSVSMVNIWITNETFTHGFLIFPISIWLIWKKREFINGLPVYSEPKIFIFLLPALLVWLLGKSVDVQIIQQFAMISLIPILCWISLGRLIFQTTLFPMLFLFFAVPFGQVLIPPMMNLTANFTVQLVQLTGIPIYQDGLFFSLPSGNWSVIEECSGVRYLIASMALGTLYAYISYTSFRKRFLFIIISGIFPVLANVFRAFAIVMVGHLSEMQMATGVDHLLYGWAFFGLIMLLLFYLGSYWWDAVEEATTNSMKTVAIRERTLLSSTFIIAVLLVISTQVLASIVSSRLTSNIKPVTLSIPDNFSEWQVSTSDEMDWKPELYNPDANINREYSHEDDRVQLNMGLYLAQRDEAEAITSLNRLVSPYNDSWKIIAFSDLQQNSLKVNESILQQGQDKLLVWHWYRIGSYQSNNRYIGKILQALNLFFKGRTDASIIMIATPVNNETLTKKRETLFKFWTQTGNQLYEQLDQTALN